MGINATQMEDGPSHSEIYVGDWFNVGSHKNLAVIKYWIYMSGRRSDSQFVIYLLLDDMFLDYQSMNQSIK